MRFVVFGLLPTFLFMGCEKEVPKKKPVRPVKAMKVGDMSSFTSRWFPGQAKATREVDLSFRVSGPLITRPVDVGDEVKKGQNVARIDPRDFQVNVRNVEGQLARAKAALKRAQTDYDRVVRIRKRDPGAVSQAMVDKAEEGVDASKADIKSLKASLDSAKDQLRYTYLRAPFVGTVVSTYVENFEFVKARQPIVRIIDHSKIEMIVNIPENLISYSDKVKKIRVTFDSFPDVELEARMKEVGKEASITTRTYPVTLIMDQPKDVKILPGMAGKAIGEGELPELAGKTGIEVLETAVFSVDDTQKTHVWIIDEKTKTVSMREVKTGDLTDFGIMVKEGIKPGEWVATAGVHYLREGQEVKLLEEPAEEGAQ